MASSHSYESVKDPLTGESGSVSGVVKYLARPADIREIFPRLSLLEQFVFGTEAPSEDADSPVWQLWKHRSEEARRGEDGYGIKPPYEYRILSGRTNSRLVLLANGGDVVRHLLEDARVGLLDQCDFKADLLLKKLLAFEPGDAREPGHTIHDYALSFLHVKAEGYGERLKSLSFYGEDLVNTSKVRETVPQVTCASCALSRAGGEVIRLSVGGFLTCPNSTRDALRAAVDALDALSRENLLVHKRVTYSPGGDLPR